MKKDANTPDKIKIRGAGAYNLKNTDASLRRIAGVSGSSKLSSALEVLYAEGSCRSPPTQYGI